MKTEEKILIASLIVGGGFIVAVVYHFSMGHAFGFGYPFNTFLFRPEDRFMDFVWPYRISADPYRVARADFQNFPALYRLASFFTPLGVLPALVLFEILLTTGLFAANWFQLHLSGRVATLGAVVIFTFCAYPALMSFDRANFEIFVFFSLYAFIFLYREKPFASAFFLGLAIALKGFPAILGILLLADRRYREALFATLVAAVLSTVSYASYPGGMISNMLQQFRNLALYNTHYALGNDGIYFGNSLWGALRFLGLLMNPAASKAPTPAIMLSWYSITSALILIILAVYVIRYERAFWKRVAILICALNLLPPVSGDYKLLHLFIPFYLFLGEIDGRASDSRFLILFGLLFIPKAYGHIPGLPEATLSVLLNPLLMLALIIVIVVSGFRSRSASTKSSEALGHIESSPEARS